MNAPAFKHTAETCEQVHKVSYAVDEIAEASISLSDSICALRYVKRDENPDLVRSYALLVQRDANAIAILAASISKGLNGGQT